MTKRFVIVSSAFLVVFGLIFGWGWVKVNLIIRPILAQIPFQPQSVSTISAQISPWEPSMSAVGSIVAINGADLSSEVSGIVDTINFQSGDNVKAGQVLLTLRPNNDPAVLAQLQATAAVDQSNYDRDRKQFIANAVSQAQVDTDKANFLAAQAQVTAQQAVMSEKVIKAPFDGTIGIRQVDIGQYLPAGTKIATLQQLNPLFVDFYVPQQALADISTGQAVHITVDTFSDKTFTGTISAIDPAIDTASRTVQVRATIQNSGLLLRPGMFATATIDIGKPKSLVTLPQVAITYNPYGDTVYVVHHGTGHDGKPALIADQTFVSLGDTRGDQVAVTKGVVAGDVVVTAGQLKLQNGAAVMVQNNVPVPNDANPTLPNE
jgi:membrane fusion protein (multidrug efflux system)